MFRFFARHRTAIFVGALGSLLATAIQGGGAAMLTFLADGSMAPAFVFGAGGGVGWLMCFMVNKWLARKERDFLLDDWPLTRCVWISLKDIVLRDNGEIEVLARVENLGPAEITVKGGRLEHVRIGSPTLPYLFHLCASLRGIQIPSGTATTVMFRMGGKESFDLDGTEYAPVYFGEDSSSSPGTAAHRSAGAIVVERSGESPVTLQIQPQRGCILLKPTMKM